MSDVIATRGLAVGYEGGTIVPGIDLALAPDAPWPSSG
jgi:hypothetical protein